MSSETFFSALSDLVEHLRECRSASETIDSDLIYKLHHVVDGALRFERALREIEPQSKSADLIRVSALALADALRRAEAASTLSALEQSIELRLQSTYIDICETCRVAVSQHNPRFLPWYESATSTNGS